jgi:phage tail sheath protein FI
MGGRRFTITARPTPEGVEIAEFYEQTAEAEPPIGFQASRWEGRFGKVFRRKHDVAVELHPGSGEAPGAPLILGVGPYRTLGEAELAELIEAVWEDRFVVAAIVTHSKCDAHLLAWAQSEFRGIQTYPDTWEGNLAAIESILAMTGN